MPSRPGRDPSIPPIPTFGIAAASLNLSATLPRDRSPPRPPQPNDVAIMSSINGNTPTSPYRPGHARSMSHPFAAPFSGLGKKRHKTTPKYEIWDSDDDDDEVTYPVAPLSTSPRKGPPPPAPGESLATGKCATCSSTVRWPRHLDVYRCTECLMVNDLQPSKRSKASGGGDISNPAEGSLRPAFELPRKEVPLSLHRTRGLISECISYYLQSLLDDSRAHLSPADNRAGRPRDPKLEGAPPLSAHSSGPGHLSVPKPGDSRIRSASASNERERFDTTKENSAHLTPHGVHLGEKTVPIRIRANSDLPESPKANRNQESGRAAAREQNHHQHRVPIFKQLEDYIIRAFRGCECLNNSFTTYQPSTRSASSGNPPKMKLDPSMVAEAPNAPVFEPDAKTLLLGDLAENSSWWMNEWAQTDAHQPAQPKAKTTQSRVVSSRSPRINWAELFQWYQVVLNAGTFWAEQWAAQKPTTVHSEADLVKSKRWESVDESVIEKDIAEARLHLQRTLLKATENLLKRPRGPLRKPEDSRFFFILLANPLLYSSGSYSRPPLDSFSHREERRPSGSQDAMRQAMSRDGKPRKNQATSSGRQSSSNHYGIIKRILGLMSNMPNDCHHYFVSWFSRFSISHFERLVDLVGGFVTYRLTRQHGRKRNETLKDGNELVPSFSSAAGNTPAELHAAISRRNPKKQAAEKRESHMVYEEDWQIKAAARIMALLFTANNANVTQKPDGALGESNGPHHSESAIRQSAHRHGNMVPISSFYNTLLDYSDLIADFETWESRSSKFSFCQFPFFLSIWAKIHILEHDARRQMEVKAREAFFNSILNHRAVSQYLVLKVRRECLVEDSLRGVSEVVGSGQEEIKKGLRIEFLGEEGVDAGGLRKEWFLLLVREVFDPHHGLFIYDEDSKYCYFNPYCFESSEQFFLVGVLLGLAIYNSTILDIDLPPFAFKKLLASAPQNNGPQPSVPPRSSFKCTLEDLAEYRPALARGLHGLLEFEGDVAETFCYDFVAQVDRYGEVVQVPLCPGGEKRPVTNANRREFVDLYVHYLLDTAVARQFEPFKRGFFTVCGGNALSLFRPEEIELLVRGSDEALDVASLRAMATYDNWTCLRAESVPVVRWFWEFFEAALPQSQRKILSFITGSDRIPAMGATSLSIRLACLGDDCSRYPIARTCFNTLGLYRYATREKFQQLLWDAVVNSEGFGLK